jgi:FkbH-like protein
LSILIATRNTPPKKLLVLDLDGVLWGGVLADDGPERIELGTTTQRGEAYKRFQEKILTLTKRGVLLAICSKNDEFYVDEVFASHPDMLLQREHFAASRINWLPKPDNIRAIANELGLGLESVVFADDSPGEIACVNMFLPEVETLLLDQDPAQFWFELSECRWFEHRTLTQEDAHRTNLYRTRALEQSARAEAIDVNAYLRSLSMVSTISDMTASDIPRVAQLINKTNQFNVTNARLSEVELAAFVQTQGTMLLTARLKDKFSDHGLVSALAATYTEKRLTIDIWVMSCRVFGRELERLVLNTLVAEARKNGVSEISCMYIANQRNGHLTEMLANLGFKLVDTASCFRFVLNIADYMQKEGVIAIHDSRTAIRRDDRAPTEHF